MQLDPNFGFKEIAGEIIRGVLDTVVAQARSLARAPGRARQTVVCTSHGL